MWPQFTEQARKVVFYAQKTADRVGSDDVATEHILLGLTEVYDSVAARILARLGVSLEQVRNSVDGKVTRRPPAHEGDLRSTNASQQVIDHAYAEANQLNDDHLGTEHILLGLIREADGLAAQVLASLKVEPVRVREEAVKLRDDSSADRYREQSELTAVPSPAPGQEKPSVGQPLPHIVLRDLMFRAAREATDSGRPLPGSEHILLALLSDENDTASKMLKRHGVTVEMLHGTLMDIYVEQEREAEGGSG